MSDEVFVGELNVEASAVATHPEGTVLDENGHPVPSQEN